MHLISLLLLLAYGAGLAVAVYACRSLLRSAQGREDAEDERLWQYLLDPRSL